MSKPAAPPLMAIFRSQVQAEILTSIMLSPEQRSITDLAAKIGAPYATVHREVERLLEVGLLKENRIGRTRLLSPNTASSARRSSDGPFPPGTPAGDRDHGSAHKAGPSVPCGNG